VDVRDHDAVTAAVQKLLGQRTVDGVHEGLDGCKTGSTTSGHVAGAQQRILIRGIVPDTVIYQIFAAGTPSRQTSVLFSVIMFQMWTKILRYFSVHF